MATNAAHKDDVIAPRRQQRWLPSLWVLSPPVKNKLLVSSDEVYVANPRLSRTWQHFPWYSLIEISSQLIGNEVGRGWVNAEAAAHWGWSCHREPGAEWTAEKPAGIPPTGPVSSPQTAPVWPFRQSRLTVSLLSTVLYHTCAGTGSIVNMVDIDSRGLIILILKGSFFCVTACVTLEALSVLTDTATDKLFPSCWTVCEYWCVRRDVQSCAWMMSVSFPSGWRRHSVQRWWSLTLTPRNWRRNKQSMPLWVNVQ